MYEDIDKLFLIDRWEINCDIINWINTTWVTHFPAPIVHNMYNIYNRNIILSIFRARKSAIGLIGNRLDRNTKIMVEVISVNWMTFFAISLKIKN